MRKNNFTRRLQKKVTHTYFHKVVYNCFSLTFWISAARWYCAVATEVALSSCWVGCDGRSSRLSAAGAVPIDWQPTPANVCK